MPAIDGRGRNQAIHSSRVQRAVTFHPAESLIPEATKLVIVEDGIAANDGQVFGLRLSDQHPIEGIAMRSREETSAGGVGGGDRKRFERLLREHCVEMESKVCALGELSDTELGGDFPG